MCEREIRLEEKLDPGGDNRELSFTVGETVIDAECAGSLF
jgi:hypothetical protein